MNESSRATPDDQGGDELEVARLVPILWAHRVWIVACTFVVTVLGCVYALMATPVYQSQATIALNESGKSSGASGIFAQLGGVGGMVASQLGMMNTSLDKIEIILKGHEIAEAVIRANDLLPVLFPASWNPQDSAWRSKDPKKIPTVRDGVEFLRRSVLKVSVENKKGVIVVSAKASDSVLSKQLVDWFLVELNNKIRRDVTTAADTDRGYLESQLDRVTDPILREKILGLIAMQFEKSMLVSSRAFEVLDRPVVPKIRISPKRTKIAVVSMFAGAALSVALIFAWKLFVAMKGLIARETASAAGGKAA